MHRCMLHTCHAPTIDFANSPRNLRRIGRRWCGVAGWSRALVEVERWGSPKVQVYSGGMAPIQIGSGAWSKRGRGGIESTRSEMSSLPPKHITMVQRVLFPDPEKAIQGRRCVAEGDAIKALMVHQQRVMQHPEVDVISRPKRIHRLKQKLRGRCGRPDRCDFQG